MQNGSKYSWDSFDKGVPMEIVYEDYPEPMYRQSSLPQNQQAQPPLYENMPVQPNQPFVMDNYQFAQAPNFGFEFKTGAFMTPTCMVIPTTAATTKSTRGSTTPASTKTIT